MKKYYIGLTGLVVVSALAIAAAMITTRPLMQDQKILTQSRDFVSALDTYVRKNNKLPESAETAVSSCTYNCDKLKASLNLVEYRVVSTSEYELCATFARASKSGASKYTSTERVDFTIHTAGRNCAQAKPYIAQNYDSARQKASSPTPTPTKSPDLQSRTTSERIATGCAKTTIQSQQQVKLTSVNFNSTNQYSLGFTGSDGKAVEYPICNKAFTAKLTKDQIKNGSTYSLGINTADGVILTISQ